MATSTAQNRSDLTKRGTNIDGRAEFFRPTGPKSRTVLFVPGKKKARGKSRAFIKKTEKRVALARVFPSICPERVPDFFLTAAGQEIRILLSWDT
jgi:hypothetical protein